MILEGNHHTVDQCRSSSFHTCCTTPLSDFSSFNLTDVRVGAWCYNDVDYLKYCEDSLGRE